MLCTRTLAQASDASPEIFRMDPTVGDPFVTAQYGRSRMTKLAVDVQEHVRIVICRTRPFQCVEEEKRGLFAFVAFWCIGVGDERKIRAKVFGAWGGNENEKK